MVRSTCIICGDVIATTDFGYCKECTQAGMSDLQCLREYLGEHPNAPLNKVVQETGIPLKKINKLLKNEFLHFSED